MWQLLEDLNFEKYQTFWTGLLGFLGIILTLIVNSAVQRRLQKKHQAHEKKVLVSSLLAELRTAQGILEFEIGLLVNDRDPDVVVSTYWHSSLVYESVLSNLGLMHEDAVEPVIRAHAVLRGMPLEFQRALGRDAQLSYGFLVVEENRSSVERLMKEALRAVMQGVSALEKKKR